MELTIDLNNRRDLVFANRVVGEQLAALGEEGPLVDLARDAASRMGGKGRTVLQGMLEHYGADRRFTLKDASQHLRTPYDELRNVMYRSIGRVLAEPLIHKQWNGVSNEYWFDQAARDALLVALA